MRQHGTTSLAEPRRTVAVDVIDAVLDNMRRNLEPLKYSTLAPSRYLVYLHPTEYARLEGIIPILQEQAVKALADEIGALNRGSLLQQYSQRVLGKSMATRTPRVEIAGGAWHIEFLPDPDGELGEGDILVDSELLVPAAPELGAGEHTRRITTIASNQRTTAREHTSRRAPAPAGAPAFARLAYDDDTGSHAFDLTRDSITIGRGGVTYPVDVKIASSPDVSREHARIRRDPQSGQCFLIDLSSLGTTLNGRHVPRGYNEVDGNKQENGADTPIPDGARIGLADTVYLSFSVVRG